MGTVSHCTTCLCRAPAQLSELLLRIFTTDVLQQRLCLCGVVTLLTQHLLTSPCALYKACRAIQLCTSFHEGPLSLKTL
jgi:hypothetical protein